MAIPPAPAKPIARKRPRVIIKAPVAAPETPAAPALQTGISPTLVAPPVQAEEDLTRSGPEDERRYPMTRAGTKWKGARELQRITKKPPAEQP